jgi:hypothetical protein
MHRYAVEVEASRAREFSIPGARIVERKEIEENGTVGFIVESQQELDLISGGDSGVIGVEPL